MLLNRRFGYISTTNSHQLDFITSWSSKMSKGQINFFLKPDSDLRVQRQSPWLWSLSTPPSCLIVLIVCETSSSLTDKSQLCWQGKWEWLVVCNKGWESELLHFSLGCNGSFHGGLDQCIYLSLPLGHWRVEVDFSFPGSAKPVTSVPFCYGESWSKILSNFGETEKL